MKKFLLVLMLTTTTSFADSVDKKLVDKLQSIAFTVESSSGSGSGVVKTRKRGNEYISFIFTAAHVVEHLRREREVVDSKTGTKRIIVEFGDAHVVKTLIEDGRTIGRLQIDAKVIRYNREEDLAVLKIRQKNFTVNSVQFYLDKDIPSIGEGLIHIGSLHGEKIGGNSLTTGIISQLGRNIEDDNGNSKVFDQTTVVAFPGSSGGGVYLEKDGRLVGMILRGVDVGFNFMCPVRRIVKWAQDSGISWAVDDNVPLPTDEALDKLVIEDNGVIFSNFTATKKSSTKTHKMFKENLNGKNNSLLRLMQSIY